MATKTASLVGLFLTAKISAGYAAATLEGYRYTLNPLAQLYSSLPTKPEAIERFLAQWSHPETKATRWRRLCTFYRWLVKRHLIRARDNPMLYAETPRARTKAARGLTRQELVRLFDYPHKPAMKTLLLLLIHCGLRREEAWGLKPSNVKDYVDQSGRAYYALVVSGKTGEREVPIPLPLRNMLRELLPWPWKTAESMGQLVRRAFRQAGIDGKRASAHTLRVTWARMWPGDKVLLKGMGGWKTWRMLEHYRPYDLEEAAREQEAWNLLNGVFTSRTRQ